MKAFKKIISMLLAAAMAAGLGLSTVTAAYADSCGGIAEEDIFEPSSMDVIKDPVLHWAVRSALNSIKDTKLITREIIGSSKMDYISYESGSHPDIFRDWIKPWLITDLEGLQYATSMTKLDISYSDAIEGSCIADLSPLSGLTQIYSLKLYHDGIRDITPLSRLTGMQELNLGGNSISEMDSLGAMTELKRLSLAYNEISDISVIGNMTKLEYIDMGSNRISELPDMSGLTSLTSLDLSHNSLSNEDVQKIASAVNLNELNLDSNNITDVKPLAALTDLDESMTFLPVSDAVKTDLFAAIEVNRAFEMINISRMTEDDLEDAQSALDSFDSLTSEQKTYIDEGMVEACRSNMALLADGFEPEYYPEYDKGGEAKPVWSRLNVRVVNKKGEPVSGATVIKKAIGTLALTTDDRGIAVVRHQASDANFDCSIRVEAPQGYVCIPEKIDYEVKNGKTYIIDGRKATGLERPEFILMPDEEYVDTSELKSFVEECGSEIVDAFRYTPASYEAYAKALKNAEELLASDSAKQDDINRAKQSLEKARAGLTMAEHLTVIKLNVRDKNNNRFIRNFKLQVYRMPGKLNPWNIWANTDDNAAYLEASPVWQDGFVFEIACCNHEAFRFDSNVTVEIGVAADGTRYFKKVNGKAVDSSFELTKRVEAIPQSIDPSKEIRPDGTGLNDYILKAEKYDAAEYTPKSYKCLTAAVDNAKSLLEKAEAESDGGSAGGIGHGSFAVTQEEFNAAAASIDDAIDQLAESPNRIQLEKLLDTLPGYTEELYTTASWAVFKAAADSAAGTFDDENADQTQIDAAAAAFRNGANQLVARASDYDRKKLGDLIGNAEKLKKDNYISGWETFSAALEDAKKVYLDEDAAQKDVEDAHGALSAAITELKEPPKPVEYECYPGIFRALVVDDNGVPVSGVVFERVIDGKVLEPSDDHDRIVSDSNGLISYYIGAENRDKLTVIRVADARYKSDDEHSFKASGSNVYMMTIDEVDGKAWNEYEDGVRLKYVISDTSVPGKKDPEDPAKPEDPTKPVNPVKPELKPLAGFKLSKTSFVYDGKAKRPALTVCDRSGRILKSGTDYSITGTPSAKKPGSYKVTVRGAGNYSGTLTRSYRIAVAKTSVASLTKGRNYFTVKAAKLSPAKVSGYQLRYSRKSSMTSAKKTVLGKKPSAVTKKVKGLKLGKRYYVQVRAYKTISGKKYYSSWSSKKSVRVG